MNTYHGQWNPPVDKILNDSYFHNIKNGTFIECGAGDGMRISSCLFFRKTLGWRGINIEPAPYLFDRLRKNRPKCTNINAALSSENGMATFTQPIHPQHGRHFGNGSLSHTKAHLEKIKDCKFKTHTVKTTTFVSLIASLRLESLDLFVLDVEGHELEVIKGMRNAPILPRIACVEYVPGLKKAMSEMGYTCDQIRFNNAYFIRT